MYKLLTKWSVALSLVLFVPLFPIPSFSQARQQAVGNKPDPIEEAQDLGELSLDELKSRRASVGDSGDLAEPVKKNVLRFLNKSIRFREKEQQLTKSNEEIAQMVATATDPSRLSLTPSVAPRWRLWSRIVFVLAPVAASTILTSLPDR